MKTIIAIGFFLLVSISVKSQTYTNPFGTFTSTSSTYYVINPTGTNKIDLIITITALSYSTVNIYGGDDEVAHIDCSNPSNIQIPLKYTIPSNYIWITVSSASNALFNVSYYSYFSQWNTIGDNIVSNNGNVGIGTFTPDAQLRISNLKQGTTVLKSTGLNGYLLIDNVASGNNYYAASVGHFFQDNSNNYLMSILANGNVGIGTTTPGYKLDVNGIGRFGASALIGTGIPAGYYQDASNGAYRSLNVGGNTGYYFQNYNGVATTMFVGLQGVYAGNVGIGTTTPGALLDVYGNVSFGDNTSNSTANLIIKGPNSPENENSKRDLSYEFLQAGKAIVRAYRGGSWDTYLQFLTSSNTNTGGEPSVRMHIDGNGNVGIGTVNPQYTLDVYGTIRAREVKVDLNGTPADYVFEKSYNLMPLSDVEKFVTTNKHLPGIPSGKEIVENGLNMGEMQNKLLEKVEELTLYTIEQDKKMKAQEEKMKAQKEINQQLLNEIKELKNLINQK